jgi:hypothetical protein
MLGKFHRHENQRPLQKKTRQARRLLSLHRGAAVPYFFHHRFEIVLHTTVLRDFIEAELQAAIRAVAAVPHARGATRPFLGEDVQPLLLATAKIEFRLDPGLLAGANVRSHS